MLIYLFLTLFVALIVVGAVKAQKRESSVYIVDAEWLDPLAKFELIARWGIK